MPARRLRRQLRLVPALLVPTARAVGWLAALGAFTVSLGLLALAVRPGLHIAPEDLLRWVRLAMIVAALGYAFLLDDPSEPTTEAWLGHYCCAARCGWRCYFPPPPPGGSRWSGGSGRLPAATTAARRTHPGGGGTIRSHARARCRRLAPGARAPRRRGGRTRLAHPGGRRLPPTCPPDPVRPARTAPNGTAPTNAGWRCSGSPWSPYSSPAATPPTAASPDRSAPSPASVLAAAQPQRTDLPSSKRSSKRPSPPPNSGIGHRTGIAAQRV